MVNLTVEKRLDSSKAEKSALFSHLKYLLFFAAIVSVASLFFFSNLDRFPLFNPDEALYAEPAREMRETGEYITTWLNYAVRFTKPPLCIWAMAGCYQIFGVTEFAARFFGAACGVILVGITFLFTRFHINARAATLSAATLIAAPLFLGTAKEAITDMPLSLFIAGALLAFYHGFITQENRWKWVAYFLLGLAVMTKGPVGVLLPAAILGIFHLLSKNVIQALKFYKPWFGYIIVGAMAGPWFITEILVTKGAYYREFILRENFQRFTGVVDHKEPPWYHIAAMFGGFFPWSFFIPAAIMKLVVDPIKARLPVAPLVLFCLSWAIFTLCFFSASVSKLFPYTLPAFPALAILVGFYWDKCFAERASRGITATFIALSIVYGLGWLSVPFVSHKLQDCPPALLGLIVTVVAVQSVAAIISLLLSMRRTAFAAVSCFMSISLVTTFVASSQALTLVSDRWERPIRNFAGYAAVSDWRILVYKIRKPSVTFYAHKKILLPRTEKELRYLLETNKHVYIIARSRDSAETLAYPGTKLISKEGNYLLVAWTNPHNISNQNPGKRTPSVRNNSQSVSDKEHNYDGDE